MLTDAQIATLRADIAAQPTLAGALAARDEPAIRNFYNAAGGSNVWRNNITPSEISSAITMADFVALTAVKQNGLLLLTQGTIDATSANVRAAFQSIFGTGATLNALTTLAQRPATRLEMLFSTPAGAASITSIVGAVLSDEDAWRAMS